MAAKWQSLSRARGGAGRGVGERFCSAAAGPATLEQSTGAHRADLSLEGAAQGDTDEDL